MPPHSIYATIIILIIVLITRVTGDCRKVFTYHPKYNYGYDIFCNNTTSLELSTTMANNAISLNIVNSNISFGQDTLKYLRKIRQFTITNAQIRFETRTNSVQSPTTGTPTATSSKPNIFAPFTHLETLIIQHSNITAEGKSYLHGLEHLVTLMLVNDTIENFPSDSFRQLKQLQTLSLSGNRIKRIEDLALCNLNGLRQLHLGNNLIAELKNDDIMCLRQLHVLDLSGNALSKLHGITSSSLNVLNVSSNRIDCIEQINAPNLTTLDVSANKLTNITADDFKGLEALITLDLSRNNLSSVVLTNKLLKHLDLAYNKLESVPNLDVEELRSLNISYNTIREVNSLDLAKFKALHTFAVGNNNLTILDCHSFANTTNIAVLDLSQNSLRNASLHFMENSTLTVLNISHNRIETLPQDLFSNLRKLKHLDVSYNKLKALNISTFKTLEVLETLNMSNNLLTQLDYKLLEPLENLIILDVDNNMIQDLDYGSIVSELPNLDAFKAKNNLLTCEFLTKMIHYFKDNDITFSLNEQLDYAKENVEGIYCKETQNKLLDLQRAREALQNNTKMLNTLYAMYNHDAAGSYSLTGGEIAMCVLLLISLVVIITLAVQKAMLWYRRRNYLVDELEMLSNEPYKSLS